MGRREREKTARRENVELIMVVCSASVFGCRGERTKIVALLLLR